MDSVFVLICSGDASWREELRQAIQARGECHCEVLEKPGDPEILDLRVKDARHPPDVIVWHIGPSVGRSCPVGVWAWAPGTRFVVVDSTGWLSSVSASSPPPVPFAVFSSAAAVREIAEAVEEATSSCWWRQLCELDMPACQISSGGRILRMNPCMREHFGTVSDTPGPFFSAIFPPRVATGWRVHPIVDCVLDSKKARADFVATELGQMQFVCLPDLFLGREVRTVSVLLPDTGRRARVLDFANDPKQKGSLEEIYGFVVDCARQLGYHRTRLYRYDVADKSFRGVASHGFVDPVRKKQFEAGFSMCIADDRPSQDILDTRLASLCIHDPDGLHLHQACTLVRVYAGHLHRNYVEELELHGCNHWVEAPLVVPGTNEVIGKIVVDNGVQSDALTVRDALDVGFLAMMAAGAIYAFQIAEERRALIRNSELLNEIYALLPRIVLETNDQRFYRVIAAILSCDPGLQWEQVLLFIADSTGLMQAECAMALGGIDCGVRQRIQQTWRGLREYVELAFQEEHGPQGDVLYERWVEFGSEEQRVHFGSEARDSGAIADLLGGSLDLPWEEIDVAQDPWCRKVNSDGPFFLGKRLFAFPLTRSFAVDSVIDGEASPTQPVGVAVVSMITEGRAVDQQRLVFTRVVLDLFGPLIAQRWTNQRMAGLYGSLYRINHADLVATWNALRATIRKLDERVGDDSLHKELAKHMVRHGGQLKQVAVAKEAIRRVEEGTHGIVNVKGLLEQRQTGWLEEWPGTSTECRLLLDVSGIPEDIEVDCGILTLSTTFTCLLRNAVEVATHRWRQGTRPQASVRVTITAESVGEYVQVLVQDDAGGVDEAMVPFLFVKGKSGFHGGRGTGLALARAGLLMNQADLQFMMDSPGDGATFRILLRRGNCRVAISNTEHQDTRRG